MRARYKNKIVLFFLDKITRFVSGAAVSLKYLDKGVSGKVVTTQFQARTCLL